VLIGEVLCFGSARVIVSALEPLPAQQQPGLLAGQFVEGLEFRSGRKAVFRLGWLVRQVVGGWLEAWLRWGGLVVQVVGAWFSRGGLVRQVVEGWPGAWLHGCWLARQVMGGWLGAWLWVVRLEVGRCLGAGSHRGKPAGGDWQMARLRDTGVWSRCISGVGGRGSGWLVLGTEGVVVGGVF